MGKKQLGSLVRTITTSLKKFGLDNPSMPFSLDARLSEMLSLYQHLANVNSIPHKLGVSECR